MGLLDDAIREHLDLKRRRGADPLEVERAEREALGPVRRAPEGQPEPGIDSEAELGSDADFADEHAGDDGWSHDSPGQAPTAPEPELGDPASHAEPPVEEFEPLTQGEDAPPSHDEDEPSLASEAPPPPHRAPQETAEYDVEEALGSEHGHGVPDDDVLEETPEFLQDTPDHDRLWFEQRPPKDFDFDG